ncbi:MAG: IclR family regulatory protein [Aeromicrobium sp.]|jgi:IclR family KDG regulon transcriptional repressor|nr:IclR family regulatory protein [Aeromicrobium sp.]
MGFAVQDPGTRRYWAGPESERIANLRPSYDLLGAVAQPFLVGLRAESGESSFVSVMDRYELLSVNCVLSESRLRMWGRAGDRGPLHATSQGKAVLSMVNEATLGRVLDAIELRAFTAQTIVDRSQLLEALREISERGFSTNNQERDDGIVSIAVPFDAGNGIVAATSIGAPVQRISLDDLVDLHVPALKEVAASISAQMIAITERGRFDQTDAPPPDRA